MTVPRILFLDQTGVVAGGELALADIVGPYRDRGRVVLFGDGPFRDLLEADGTAVIVLESDRGWPLGPLRRESGPLRGLLAVPGLIGLAWRVARLARGHDLIYANSQKAAVVGALAARLTRRPLVIHLHDILSADHFSRANRIAAVAAARTAKAVIADSKATADALVAAGGPIQRCHVVYYGFGPSGVARNEDRTEARREVRSEFGIDPEAFVVGHVGRLSPWKGQDIFIRALAQVPDAVGVVVGTALFGEDQIEPQLRQLAADLGVADRLTFTGLRSDVPRLMAACDLMVHSSTAPEPFGRVIVEAMVAGTPVVAAGAGGPREIVDDGRTGWLTEPGDVEALADRIRACADDPAGPAEVAKVAERVATERFSLEAMHAGVAAVIAGAIER